VASPTEKPTSLPTIVAQVGAPTTTSEATIAPSGVEASGLPTIIAQFPTVDMSMSMKLNFFWANEDFRSLLLEHEEQMDLLQ
jgi:hypothetical protein